MPDVRVGATPESVARRGAVEFQTRARAAIAIKGRFAVALSGGSTPRLMLSLLASPEFAASIDWTHVDVFWSDERCVPPDDPASNYGMARRELLEKVGLGTNVHRMRGELEPETGAADYCVALRRFFPDGATVFDLAYLGLGKDGHTASLFPFSAALRRSDAPCVANRAPEGVSPPWRLTLSYPAINASAAVVFLVTGAEKAPVLAQVLEGRPDTERLPAQGVAPSNGRIVWLVDASAAAALSAN